MGKWNRLTDVRGEKGGANRKKSIRDTDSNVGKAWEGGGRVEGGKVRDGDICNRVNNF